MSIDELGESHIDRMSEEQLREFLTEQGVGVLGLSDQGLPYLVPMSFGFDGEDSLYFVFLLFGIQSRKEALAKQSERARFLVYAANSMHDWRSASLTGRLDAVDDNEWSELQTAMENAWHPSLFRSATPMRGIEGYEFRIEDWTGIRSVD